MAAAEVTVPANPDIRVLLVDDQPQFRRAAAMLIQATAGLALAGEAGSGEEAISLTRDLKPDLVLMDVRLPGINGPDATRQILADQPDTKVILVSTYEQSDLPDIDTCGATRFVRKQDLDAQTLLY
jgi:DNA-binding NarL/FixJ family response regulator